MKQVEMWKWFKLPVDCSVVDKLDMSDAVGINLHETLSSHHAEKVEIAINSYDQHVELISKQAQEIERLKQDRNSIAMRERNKHLVQMNLMSEKIKMLREALQLVDGNDDKLNQSWVDCGYHKVIDAALSATEQE